MSILKRLALSSPVLAAVGVCSLAKAQTPPAGDVAVSSVSEVIVTAEKRVERAQDVP